MGLLTLTFLMFWFTALKINHAAPGWHAVRGRCRVRGPGSPPICLWHDGGGIKARSEFRDVLSTLPHVHRPVCLYWGVFLLVWLPINRLILVFPWRIYLPAWCTLSCIWDTVIYCLGKLISKEHSFRENIYEDPCKILFRPSFMPHQYITGIN